MRQMPAPEPVTIGPPHPRPATKEVVEAATEVCSRRGRIKGGFSNTHNYPKNHRFRATLDGEELISSMSIVMFPHESRMLDVHIIAEIG